MTELGARQWQEWLGFFSRNPSGSFHDELRWGHLLSILMNQWAKEPVKPSDILPSLKAAFDEAPALPLEVQAARLKAWAEARLEQQKRLPGGMAE